MPKNEEKGTARKAILSFSVILGIITGSVFDSPAEIFEEENRKISEPAAYVQVLEDGIDIDTEDELTDNSSRKRRKLGTGIRNIILKLPLWARALFVFPLWIIGSAVLWFLSNLWAGAQGFLTGVFLPWLCLIAAAALIIYGICKVLFPDIKLKDVFYKRNTFIFLISSLVLLILDFVLPIFGADDYSRYIRFAGPLLLVCSIVLTVYVSRKQKSPVKK